MSKLSGFHFLLLWDVTAWQLSHLRVTFPVISELVLQGSKDLLSWESVLCPVAVAAGCSVKGATVSSHCSSDAESSGLRDPTLPLWPLGFSFLLRETELPWVWVCWPVGISGVPGGYMEGTLSLGSHLSGLHVFSLS